MAIVSVFPANASQNDQANTFTTGPNAFRAGADNQSAITLARNSATQSAAIAQWAQAQSEGGAVFGSITAAGNLSMVAGSDIRFGGGSATAPDVRGPAGSTDFYIGGPSGSGHFYFTTNGIARFRINSSSANLAANAAGTEGTNTIAAIAQTGTNVAGFDVYLGSGLGTGNANPGILGIVTGQIGSSGTTAHSKTNGTRLKFGYGDVTNNFADITVQAKANLVCQTAALATTAARGFTYIPTCAGAPSGTPDAKTGTVAMVYDTTNNAFYLYNGAWKSVALA